MIKNLIGALVMLLMSTSVQAQIEFAPLGAEWSYRSSYGSLGPGHERILKLKCVAVDTQDMRIVKTIETWEKHQRLSAVNTYFERTDTLLRIDSVYATNDTVYIYNPIFQRYTPLYVFNVQEGDTLRLPVLDTSNISTTSAFDSNMYIIIDSIRMVDYAGVLLETFYTSSYNGGVDFAASPLKTFYPAYNWTTSKTYVSLVDSLGDTLNFSFYTSRGGFTRVFGGIGAGLLPRPLYAFNASIVDGMFPNDTLACYADANIQFNRTMYACDSFKHNTPLALNNINSKLPIKIHPNPAHERLFVDVEAPLARLNLLVVDMFGREVLHEKSLHSGSNSIDLRALSPGLYLLVFEAQGQRYVHKLLKQ